MPTLREARTAQFLSQQELAEAAGVAKSTIATIEQGVHRPRPRTARRLAAVLGVPPGEIAWSAGNGKDAGHGE